MEDGEGLAALEEYKNKMEQMQQTIAKDELLHQ